MDAGIITFPGKPKTTSERPQSGPGDSVKGLRKSLSAQEEETGWNRGNIYLVPDLRLLSRRSGTFFILST